jgi:hypothetical protein
LPGILAAKYIYFKTLAGISECDAIPDFVMPSAHRQKPQRRNGGQGGEAAGAQVPAWAETNSAAHG